MMVDEQARATDDKCLVSHQQQQRQSTKRRKRIKQSAQQQTSDAAREDDGHAGADDLRQYNLAIDSRYFHSEFYLGLTIHLDMVVVAHDNDRRTGTGHAL